MTMIEGNQISAWQAKVIASALRLWAVHRIRANRSYTPARMMEVAQAITGRKFKKLDYLGAAKALEAQSSRPSLREGVER